MRKIGYIRTSTMKQITDRQVIQIREACDEYYIEDGVSAVQKKRPVYQRVMRRLEPGDVFVVLSLDRAFRSVIDAVSELEAMRQRGIHFQSLTQNFDTSTPDGKLLYILTAAVAEWERDILIRRTKEGMQAAKLRGKTLGRPKKLSAKQIREARRLLKDETYSSLIEVAEHFSVHEKTLQRALAKHLH